MEVAQATGLRYETYSYSDRADIYHATLNLESAARLHQAAGGLKYTRLKEQIAAASPEPVFYQWDLLRSLGRTWHRGRKFFEI